MKTKKEETYFITMKLMNLLSAQGFKPRTEVMVREKGSMFYGDKQCGRIDVYCKDETSGDDYVFEIKNSYSDLANGKTGKNFYGNYNFLVINDSEEMNKAKNVFYRDKHNDYVGLIVMINHYGEYKFEVYKKCKKVGNDNFIFYPQEFRKLMILN